MRKHVKILLLISMLLLSLASYALQPQRGYRGFVDSDNFLILDLGFMVGEGGNSEFWTGFTTSHGYQFNNWLYVGGGAGMVYNLGWKPYSSSMNRCIIPIFSEVRFDAKWGKFTPYFSAQVGGNFTIKGADGGGIYASPMIGYRFNWGRKSAINFGLGITMYGVTNEHYNKFDIVNREPVYSEGTYRTLGEAVLFTFRLGVEF